MKLWHCYNARSIRPLWALEEMGLDYEVETMPFPPRYLKKDYMEINPLGTIPYFIDGVTHMTESSGICLYLAEKHPEKALGLNKDHFEYGDYLNWLFHSDATLTFPQTIVLRYSMLEQGERRLPQAVADYRAWFFGRLSKLDAHIATREFLCAERFTVADIAIGFALHLGQLLDLDKDYTPQTAEYLARLQARPAFKRVQEIGKEFNVF